MLDELLLAAIYAVVTDELAFKRLGELVAERLNYRYALLSVHQNGLPVEMSLNQPELVMAAYTDYYFKLDPWAGVAARTPYGEVIAPIPDDPRFYDSEFYVDFARPMGVVDPVGVRLPVSAGTELVVGLNQPFGSALPTPEDGNAVQAVARHLRRALQLRQQFAGVTADRNGMLAALHELEFGVAIAASDGRVHALNQAAEAALPGGCGLRIRNGMLMADDSASSASLSQLIRDATNGGSGGAMLLKAGENGWTSLLVSPLPPQAGWPSIGARALVAFRAPGLPANLDARLLMSMFALSRGEAQVAIALMDGLALEEIAQRRGVKPSTVKSQLDAVFNKTDTSSQRALVRLLGSLPPLRLG